MGTVAGACGLVVRARLWLLCLAGWWGGGGGLGDPSGAVGRGLSSPSSKKCVRFAVSLVFCMYETAASSFLLDLSSVVPVSLWPPGLVAFPLEFGGLGGPRSGSSAHPS